ncbi:Sec63 Brl domain-containing protein [Mycena floridula]|nr:Sec63 Brl domain-containing protein [Mycena floridula]
MNREVVEDLYYEDESYLDYTNPNQSFYDDSDDIVNTSPSPATRFGSGQYAPLNQYYNQRDQIDDYIDEEGFDDGLDDTHYQPRYQNPPSNNNSQYGYGYDYASSRQNNFNPRNQPNRSQQIAPRPPVNQQAPSPPPRGSNPRNAHGIRLVPVSDLPDIYRGLFKFGVFNAVQSNCFEPVLQSNDNMVISAPTGSGKTVLFELAILRMVTLAKDTGTSMKAVYMAPTKSLCSERYRDWSNKFTPLGFECCELTGDTIVLGKGVWGNAKNASIIITTGEKWDSLTRNWEQHTAILSQIQLFLVDEVHILNETRGSTLEVVISRMKLRGSDVRFVLVSATVPNIEDIAAWIGSGAGDNEAAQVFQFGEDFRPCKLKRIVIGVPRPKGQNDFVFQKTLDYKLFAALQKYCFGKPVLVFGSTRKGVFDTAEQVKKEYCEAQRQRQSLPWKSPPRIDHNFTDKRLQDLATAGIGVHHAGLTLEDRRATEDLYMRRVLYIVFATSTLAVGVNLPAHTVVIKGVQIYQNGINAEYSDLDVMQMLGRAGRPQFDKEGTGIIICESELEDKYRALVQGQTVLESSLHKNLAEHLNSEIGLGTITNIRSAKSWLRKSFMFQRIQKNPKHYSVGKNDEQTWEDRMDDLVLQSVGRLKETQLVEYNDTDPNGRLASTEFGDIMTKFYLRQATMGLILALPEKPTVRDILDVISSAEEVTDKKIRAGEKPPLNKLRRSDDIRYEVKKMEKPSDKVCVLIQAILGGISLSSPEYKSVDSQLHLEAHGVFQHIIRIARAIVEVGLSRQRGAQIKHGLELVRCFTAKAWEDRPVVLRQIDSIGEKSIKVLAEHKITSLELLRAQSPLRIETLLNRRTPFGLDMLAAVNAFPNYSLRVTELKVYSYKGKSPVQVDLSIQCGLLSDPSAQPKYNKKQKSRESNMTTVLTLTSGLDLIDFRRIPTKALRDNKTFEVNVELDRPSLSVSVCISSESVAGVNVVRLYKPNIPSHEYPTMDTHPRTAMEMEVEGLDNMTDFWNVDLEEDEKNVTIKDLSTKSRDDQPNPPVGKMTETKRASEESQAPRKLSNGKYECNHNCKDKQKCRHLCCRDGLPDPPKASKSRASAGSNKSISTEASQPSKSSAASSSSVKQTQSSSGNQTLLSVQKVKPVRPNRTLDDLESLHKRTNVKENLKLADGQRLKLEPSPQATRKRKTAPDFNVKFSDITDPRDLEATSHVLDILDDDDDDLPEPHEILNSSRKRPSSSDSFPDPEMDALIRDLPSPDTAVLQPISTFSNSSRDSFASPISRKRSIEPVLRPPKRAKRETFKAETPTNFKTKGSPLFYPGSDDKLYEDLDITDTPDLTMSSVISLEDSDDVPMFDSFNEKNMEPQKNSEDCVKEVQREDIEAMEEDVDEFAEFEQWLNSGAVQIIN